MEQEAGEHENGTSEQLEQSSEGGNIQQREEPHRQEDDDLNQDEREAHQVPVGVLQRERHKYQQKITALEAKLASLEKVATKKANSEGGTNEEKERARQQFRKALGIDEMQDMVSDMRDSLSELSNRVGELQQFSSREQKRYVASVEGYVLDKFFKSSELPVDSQTYSKFYGNELSDEEQAIIMDPNSEPSEIHAVLESVHKRVARSLKGIVRERDISKDYGKVRSLPKVPGLGGGPPPPPERQVLLGKDLHRHAQRVFQDALERNR